MDHERWMSVIGPVLHRELEKIEWGGAGGTCPSCGASSSDGHRRDCSLRGALSLAVRDPNDTDRTRKGALAVIARMDGGMENLAPEIAQGVVEDDRPHLEAVGT